MGIFKHIKCTEYEMGNIIVFRAVLSFFSFILSYILWNGVFEQEHSATTTRFFLGVHKKNKKWYLPWCPNFLATGKNKSCNKRLEVFHKVGLQVEGCSSMHIDYWKWKYLLCLARYIFIALSKFWNFIHNDRNCPILDKYDNKIIRFRLYYFHFLPKRRALSPRLPIYFKYNNHIHSKNLGLEDWKKIDMMVS